MEKLAVVFDMDDTLYSERQYVNNGLMAVAMHVEEFSVQHSADTYLQFMLDKLDTNGRGRLFDDLVIAFELKDIKVAKLVQIYRRHSPVLCLDKYAKVAVDAARYFSGLPVHVVTDGHRMVQRMKARALGLENLVDRIWYTRDFGLEIEKPNVAVFLKLAQSLGIQRSEFVYVGDDPSKDFIAPRQLGAKSIRVRTGRMSKKEPNPGFEPDFEINSLRHLPEILAKLY